MNNDEHIGDDAALYALGALERSEIERIDAHVARCDTCAAELGEAEAALATLAEAELSAQPSAPAALQPRPRRPASIRWTRWSAGLAAAFALATAGLGARDIALSRTVGSDNHLLLAMVQSHFAHVQFATPNHTPLPAKLVYERHGAWYELISADPRAAAVVEIRPGGETLREKLPGRRENGIATMTLQTHGALDRVRLLDAAGAEIASATPATAERNTP